MSNHVKALCLSQILINRSFWQLPVINKFTERLQSSLCKEAEGIQLPIQAPDLDEAEGRVWEMLLPIVNLHVFAAAFLVVLVKGVGLSRRKCRILKSSVAKLRSTCMYIRYEYAATHRCRPPRGGAFHDEPIGTETKRAFRHLKLKFHKPPKLQKLLFTPFQSQNIHRFNMI